MDYKDINDFEVLYLIEEEQYDYKEIIFDKYKPILQRKASDYYIKVKNYGVEYDDMYQEALIGLNYAIDHFNNNSNTLFYTYALLCINSKLSSYCKHVANSRNKILNESVDLSQFDNLSIENIGNVCFDDEYISFYNKIVRFKNSLSNVQSQVFELKYNGFSNRDIGTLLGMTVKNVYYHFCCIRNKLTISGFSL